jgi:hypothetical protein
MFLLSEGFEKDQVKISRSNTKLIKGLKSARIAPNRRVNLHTVDVGARLTANTIANMILKKEFKIKENGEE